MKELLREVLAAETEADRMVAEAQMRAAEIRREAIDAAEAHRRSQRAAASAREQEILKTAAEQTASDEERSISACDAEIAAIFRRFEECRSAVAEMLARRVLPVSRHEA
jgi:vacuolar-type H+-ATPase subunit H